MNEPVSLCWNELATRDTEIAQRFYGALFGWEFGGDPEAENPYFDITNRGRGNGGILPMNEEWGNAPPYWTPYVSVEDCDATLARARELGAAVLFEPIDIPYGRFAGIADPHGAVLTVMKVLDPE